MDAEPMHGAGAGAAGPRREELEVDGRTAAFLQSGSGPPVILVHGLGLSADVWSPHLRHIARRGFTVIAPDLPGFGDTPGPALGQRVGETAAWLERFAAALGVRRAAWIGHSISTQVLLRLAARRPRLVAALVLAAPTGQGETEARRAARQFGGLARDALRERASLAAAVVRRYLSAPLSTVGTWIRALRHRPERDATRVSCPTLVVLGDDDPVVTEAFAERLVALLADGRMARLSGAAHAVAIDRSDAFSTLAADFLVARYTRSR